MRREQWVPAVLSALAAIAAGYGVWRRAAAERRSRSGRLESRRMRVGGLTIQARVSVDPVPRGRVPVVLVHGLGMSSRYMIPLARHLAPEFRVYAPDLPGFGLSDKPAHALAVPELADALSGFMDSVGLRRAAYVGNSLGCEILVEFARRHPERVEALVLQGPTPDPDVRSAAQQVVLFLVTALFERRSLAWVALSDYLRGGACRYIRTFRHMTAYRIKDKLPGIRAPTLVVWGSRDYITPRWSVEQMARLVPHGRLIVVPGAAHGMNYSHPRQLLDAILPFLRARTPSRGPEPLCPRRSPPARIGGGRRPRRDRGSAP